MSKEKVAIVTGSNKGIGFAIVKGLCERFDGVVYLTSRDEDRGRAAVAQLQTLSYNPRYHQLDVADKQSVKRFRDHIKKEHGGIDILINNAGISGYTYLSKNTYENKKSVIDVNYRGVVTVEEYLFPLLRKSARVLNISSDCGHLSNLRNKEWIERLSKKDLTRNDIEDFINWYLESEKKGTFNPNDIADNGTIPNYRVSKVALCALTIIQQRETESLDISVNSMHPGLVRTDMVSGVGTLTPDEAAITPIYLVLDAPQSLKGKYIWYDKKEVDWYDFKNPCYFKVNTFYRVLGLIIIEFSVKFLTSSGLRVAALSFGLIAVLAKYYDKLV